MFVHCGIYLHMHCIYIHMHARCSKFNFKIKNEFWNQRQQRQRQRSYHCVWLIVLCRWTIKIAWFQCIHVFGWASFSALQLSICSFCCGLCCCCFVVSDTFMYTLFETCSAFSHMKAQKKDSNWKPSENLYICVRMCVCVCVHVYSYNHVSHQ